MKVFNLPENFRDYDWVVVCKRYFGYSCESVHGSGDHAALAYWHAVASGYTCPTCGDMVLSIGEVEPADWDKDNKVEDKGFCYRPFFE